VLKPSASERGPNSFDSDRRLKPTRWRSLGDPVGRWPASALQATLISQLEALQRRAMPASLDERSKQAPKPRKKR